jgi:predicted metal-dependent phosphoesterase TrpH
MADGLREAGFALVVEPLERRWEAGEPVGRPHLAAAAVSHPGNAARLAAEGIDSPGAFIEAYLVPGASGYVTRTTPTVEQAIRAIHDAGGVAVWAHPFWDMDTDEAVLDTIDRFDALGIDGVEAFYATHTRAQTHLIAGRCAELGLLTTGSADFHGPEHGTFARFRAFDLYGLEPALGPIAAPPASSDASR